MIIFDDRSTITGQIIMYTAAAALSGKRLRRLSAQ
jgi:hypothetical protein